MTEDVHDDPEGLARMARAELRRRGKSEDEIEAKATASPARGEAQDANDDGDA